MAKRSKADVKYAIDLLWTHQVRRENAFLHREIERLREEVSSASTGLDAIRQTAHSAQKSAEQSIATIPKTEKVQHDLATTVGDAAQRIEDVAREADLLGPRIDGIKRQVELSVAETSSTVRQLDSRIQKLDGEQQQRLASINDELTNLKRQLESKADIAATEVLQSRFAELQEQVTNANECQQSLGVVIDSIEEAPERVEVGPATEKPQWPNNASRNAKLPSFLLSQDRTMAPPLLRRQVYTDDDRRREDMLTLQPRTLARESTVSDDFDLDENVSTMTYARDRQNQYNTNVEDSMPMLPVQQSIQPATFSEMLGLKQGSFHSWDRYYAEGESLFKRLPRDREFFVVKAFLEGLYDAIQRGACQKWLDVNGWTWSSIGLFPHASTPAVGMQRSKNDLTSDETRVQSPVKVRFEEPVKPAEHPSKPAPVRHVQKISRAKSQPVAVSQGTRRSQRLIELDEALQRPSQRQSHMQQPHQKTSPGGQQSVAANECEATGGSQYPHVAGQRKLQTPAKDVGNRPQENLTKKQDSKQPRKAKLSSVTAMQQKAAPSRAKQSQRKVNAAPTKTASTRRSKMGAPRLASVLQNDVQLQKPPASAQQEICEPPSTPVRQRSPSPFRGIQPAPRLVKKKRAASCVDDTDEDVPLPRAAEKKTCEVMAGLGRAAPKKRRLPLPPPPAIPIMPTSED